MINNSENFRITLPTKLLNPKIAPLDGNIKPKCDSFFKMICSFSQVDNISLKYVALIVFSESSNQCLTHDDLCQN